MLATDNAPAPVRLEAHDAPYHIGAVSLRVRGLAGLTAFYRDAIGLQLISQGADKAVLGIDGEPLVTLEAGAQPQASKAGLFHIAILLPSRRDLANWLAHAAESGVRLEGASDHLVSEAIYLSDPEGNGIEIYRDRSRPEWPRRDGAIAMATERLDLNALLGEANGAAYPGMPSGTRMGHIHLRVGDTNQAEAFYRDALGFDLMVSYPGASFLASGGYHHHIGANVWQSRGAGRRQDGETGLAAFELVAKDDAAFAAMRQRMVAAGGQDNGETATVADPWNNRLILRR
jgi:catechol 2,3-dioxygenase